MERRRIQRNLLKKEISKVQMGFGPGKKRQQLKKRSPKSSTRYFDVRVEIE